MSDIEAGDWVTIAGCGPYEVESLGGRAATDEAPRRLVLKVGIGRPWVLGEWCEKVPAPFRPEPGTYWLDSSYGPGVWRAIHNGQMQLLSTDICYAAESVQKMYGPLVQLVPKEQA